MAVILSRLITIGFLGSIFSMFRFSKYCRLLNSRDLEAEEAERYQARARQWLAAIGAFLGGVALAIIASIILQ